MNTTMRHGASRLAPWALGVLLWSCTEGGSGASSATGGASSSGGTGSSSGGQSGTAGSSGQGVGGAGVRHELSGVVQKGPFINGTSIAVYELDGSLTATGKIFNTTILDNSGAFALTKIDFQSQYVELKAEGFYYDEIKGEKSVSPLTLYAFSDLTQPGTVNVNSLSHLEHSRVTTLVAAGKGFSEARKQAQKEILSVFSLSPDYLGPSENLSISEAGNGNAVLLALSVILQGYRTTAELSELLADINTDLRTDGTLDSQTTGSKLINDASLTDLGTVRSHLEQRYKDLGITATIPAFESYVNEFITKTLFKKTVKIDYPATTANGANLLFGDTVPSTTGNVSFAATLPLGTSLKVVLKDGIWGYQAAPNGPVNWTISQYDSNLRTQTFTATESGKTSDALLSGFQGTITLEIYENKATTPTRTRTFTPTPGGAGGSKGR